MIGRLLDWLGDGLRRMSEVAEARAVEAEVQAEQLLRDHVHAHDALRAAPNDRVRRAVWRRMEAMGFGRGDTATRMLYRDQD